MKESIKYTIYSLIGLLLLSWIFIPSVSDGTFWDCVGYVSPRAQFWAINRDIVKIRNDLNKKEKDTLFLMQFQTRYQMRWALQFYAEEKKKLDNRLYELYSKALDVYIVNHPEAEEILGAKGHSTN